MMETHVSMADRVHEIFASMPAIGLHYKHLYRLCLRHWPKQFEVTESRRTPWYSLSTRISEDTRFERIQSGFYCLRSRKWE